MTRSRGSLAALVGLAAAVVVPAVVLAWWLAGYEDVPGPPTGGGELVDERVSA